MTLENADWSLQGLGRRVYEDGSSFRPETKPEMPLKVRLVRGEVEPLWRSYQGLVMGQHRLPMRAQGVLVCC